MPRSWTVHKPVYANFQIVDNRDRNLKLPR